MTPVPTTVARLRVLGILLSLVIVAALVALVVRGIGPPPEDDRVLRLRGSGTVGFGLMPALAEGYLRNRGALDVRTESAGDLTAVTGTVPGADRPTRIEVVTTGSASAFTGLRSGETDVGMAARRITEDERRDLADRGDLTSRRSEHVLALDAVTVIVNPARRITALDLGQLRDVYTCAITDWSQLGPDAGSGPIRVLAFREGSGTLDTFRDAVLGDQPFCPAVERLAGEEIAPTVTADPSAVAFVGLPFVGGNTALALGAGGSVPIAPTRLAVSTESYLLTRRLYLYLPTEPVDDPLARELVEGYALSPAGQRIVADSGFVSPLFEPEPEPGLLPPACTADLPAYCDLVAGAERVPFDVRFDPGTDRLDNRAFRNLDLFAAGLAGREVLLVGFADNAGTDDANLGLSRQRSAAVAAYLAERGVEGALTLGFGEALPVDTNDTPEGREQNRRVEVWLR